MADKVKFTFRESSSLSRVQFTNSPTRRKLQKARPFFLILHNIISNKTKQLFEVYALRRFGEIGPRCGISTEKILSFFLICIEFIMSYKCGFMRAVTVRANASTFLCIKIR